MAEVLKDTEDLTIIIDAAEVSIPLTDKEYADTTKAMVEVMSRRSDLQGDIARLKAEFEKNKQEIEPLIEDADDSIKESLALLRANSKRAQEQCQFHYDWKKNVLTVFRIVAGSLVEVQGYGREIRPDERQTLLPLEQRVAITGDAANGHSVKVAGNEITTDGAPFTWGKKVSPGSVSLAKAILSKFAPEEDANKFAEDFVTEFLLDKKASEDFVIELDVGKWVTWKQNNPVTEEQK